MDTFLLGLYEDKAGRIWVAGRDSLAVRGLGDGFTTVQDDGQNLSLTIGSSMSSGADGSLLAVTRGELLSISTKDGGRSWQTRQRIAQSEQVSSVVAGPDGSVFFGCGKDICQTRGTDTHPQPIKKWGRAQGVPADNWRSIMLKRNGELWVRGRMHTIVLLRDGKSFLSRDLPSPVVTTRIPAMAEDSSGNVLAAYGPSLGIFNGKSWRIISEANGLEDGRIDAVLVDRQGSVWLGTVGHGLKNWIGYGNWEHWTRRRLSASDRSLLSKHGVLLKGDWFISPSLVGGCRKRVGVERYLGDAIAGSLGAAQSEFVAHNKALLVRVLKTIWPAVGSSPAVQDDGAFSHEKWGILEFGALPSIDLNDILRQTLASQGLTDDFVSFELRSPSPGLKVDIEKILAREENASTRRDRTSTTQIYCLAILYDLGQKGVEHRFAVLQASAQTTKAEKDVISVILARMRSKGQILWEDVEELDP